MPFNYIQGNVYIITSAGVYLTGEIKGVSSAGNINGPFPKCLISNIGLYGTDSTGELAISYASANSDVTYHLRCPVDGGYADIHFATPHMVSESLYVHTLTAGTGYIYFS